MNNLLSRTAVSALAIGGVIALSGCVAMSDMPRFAWPKSRAALEKAPNPCVDFDVSIYFASNVSSLSRDNRMALSNAADQTKGCNLTGVIVTGLADPVGSPAVNLAISQKRADAVRAALSGEGLTNVIFSVDAAGALGAANSDGSVDPLRRRAEVQFHFKPAGS